MNTDALPESEAGTQRDSLAALSPIRPLYWSVRRELWEHRSIYVAPLLVAAVFLFGFLISSFRLPAKMRDALTAATIHQQNMLEQPYNFAALLIMGTTFLVAVFYSLDALHGERRDRSILFWKSLPVSDRTTVLSKAIIPIVFLPLLTVAITIVMHWIMLLWSAVILMGSGVGAASLWTQLHLSKLTTILLYHMVVMHGLYLAPVFCWLLLVSAWARRATFLWAGLPLLVIGAFEKIVFNTTHFAHILGSRMAGGGSDFPTTGDSLSIHPLSHFAPLDFLISPGMLIGLVVAAAFLAAAIRLRRNREPI
jgi:ABC-2 type transport system permease protein